MPDADGTKLKDLSRTRLRRENVDAWQEEMNKASDRACALVGSAAIEHDLVLLIKTALADELPQALIERVFFAQGAPLATLSNKGDMARALGLIDDATLRQIGLVRRIRNAFAHSANPLTFDHGPIKDVCDSLGKTLEGMPNTQRGSPREQFVAAVRQIVVRVLNIAGDRMEAENNALRQRLFGHEEKLQHKRLPRDEAIKSLEDGIKKPK